MRFRKYLIERAIMPGAHVDEIQKVLFKLKNKLHKKNNDTVLSILRKTLEPLSVQIYFDPDLILKGKMAAKGRVNLKHSRVDLTLGLDYLQRLGDKSTFNIAMAEIVEIIGHEAIHFHQLGSMVARGTTPQQYMMPPSAKDNPEGYLSHRKEMMTFAYMIASKLARSFSSKAAFDLLRKPQSLAKVSFYYNGYLARFDVNSKVMKTLHKLIFSYLEEFFKK